MKRDRRSKYNRPLAKLMRRWGWNFAHGTVRHRVWDLITCNHRWYDWGHRVMILTGSDFGGNWSEPSPPTWWYRPGTPLRMWRTGYPRARLHVVRDYTTFMAETEGLDVGSDEHYSWRAIGTGQDNDLHLGRMYWGGTFYGLGYAELRVLTRWLIRWQFINWFGVRSWLYSQGLNAAVYQRTPFGCNQAPPKGSGGYSHWLCQNRNRHSGPHRFRNYEWTDGERVNHNTERASA